MVKSKIGVSPWLLFTPYVLFLAAVAQKKHDVYGVWSKNIQSSVKETNEQLTAINNILDSLVPLVNNLNELLPVDQRLPSFSQSPS